MDQVQATLVKEKDLLKLEVKDMVDVKNRLEKEKTYLTNNLKESTTKFLAQIKDLETNLSKEINDRMKIEKQLKQSMDEREKMKLRITKLKNRKGKVDHGIKLCRNCGKEFPEKENFNWSCRTHQYDYSGEMWWCCGKRGRDQPGCKFSKHEYKEDNDEEDDENDKEKNKQKQMKLMRCQCCKELGHSMENCERDPNIKTKGEDLE